MNKNYVCAQANPIDSEIGFRFSAHWIWMNQYIKGYFELWDPISSLSVSLTESARVFSS